MGPALSAADLDARAARAVDLARDAGALALRMRGTLAAADAKSPLDFCTEADRAVENFLRDELVGAFGDQFIGEEHGGDAGARVWVVDPIDGTAGYIHGTPRWCVSIAFVCDGEIEIGVIYAPVGDRLFVARRGGGATLNGDKISVSRLAHGTAPIVELGWSERRPITDFCALLQRLTAAGIEFRRHGSGALGMAEAAAGLSDGYVELHINAWDVLAGILLVREAGGVVNDFLADDGLRRGNMIVATTPEIAHRVAECIKT
jgi:myo-inositol-1(or 4)-monophosphatase